ncbi:MAG: zinc ribbon domain-containing protein [Bacteroidota bacterium]
MEKLQKLSEELIKVDLDNKSKKYKYCQSCGKNYSAMRLNGKDKNGNYNPAFCIDCYDNGEFKEPDLPLN